MVARRHAAAASPAAAASAAAAAAAAPTVRAALAALRLPHVADGGDAALDARQGAHVLEGCGVLMLLPQGRTQRKEADRRRGGSKQRAKRGAQRGAARDAATSCAPLTYAPTIEQPDAAAKLLSFVSTTYASAAA